MVAPRAGGVDRNLLPLMNDTNAVRRPPRGGVDRNLSRAAIDKMPWAAPRAGAWIETPIEKC